MDILELITGKRKQQAKGQLRNLIEVATSDGNFDGIEVDYLLSLAGRFNISEAELKKIKEEPATATYQAPTNDKERFEHLYQLICMMMIDGEIHEKELERCRSFSKKLELKPEFVSDMIEVMKEEKKRESPTEIVIGKLLRIAQERELKRTEQVV